MSFKYWSLQAITSLTQASKANHKPNKLCNYSVDVFRAVIFRKIYLNGFPHDKYQFDKDMLPISRSQGASIIL